MEVNLADMHLAVSEYFDLDHVLSTDKGLNSMVFPLVPEDEGTDSRQIYVEVDGTLVGLEIHYKRCPDFSTDDFENAGMVEGCGELELIVSSGDSQASGKLVQRFAETMPHFFQLNPTSGFNQRNRGRLHGKVGLSNLSLEFFETYRKIIARLDDVKEKEKRDLKGGALYNFLKSCLIYDFKERFDKDKFNLRYLQRVEGVYEGIPAELSLVHVSSTIFNGIKGVYLASKDKEICMCDENVTDHSMVFSGHIFQPDIAFYGGSTAKEKILIQKSCKEKGYIALLGNETEWESVRDSINSDNDIGKERKEPTAKFAKLAYNLRINDDLSLIHTKNLIS